MSNGQILTIGALASLNGAYIYVQKVVVPQSIDAFLKADARVQVSVGGLAGMYIL